MYTWHKIEHISATLLSENKMQEFAVADKKIGLVKRHDKIYAFSATCPHASASLCDGWMDAQGRIVCPLHHYRYDPANGRNTSGEGYKLKTYLVEIKNDEIFVGVLS